MIFTQGFSVQMNAKTRLHHKPKQPPKKVGKDKLYGEVEHEGF